MLFSAIMVINVLSRFLFKNSVPWASELVLTIFVWFVWLGISYAFKEKVHIRVTVIVGLFPQRIQKIIAILMNFLILIFMIILLKSGIDLLGHNSVRGKTSLLLNYPMWFFYLSSCFGVSLSIIRIIQNSLDEIKNKRS